MKDTENYLSTDTYNRFFFVSQYGWVILKVIEFQLITINRFHDKWSHREFLNVILTDYCHVMLGEILAMYKFKNYQISKGNSGHFIPTLIQE